MAGADRAIGGYEYQFLRTLEYASNGVVFESTALTSMSVENPPEPTNTGDADIVDFGLHNEAGQVTLAQVTWNTAEQHDRSRAHLANKVNAIVNRAHECRRAAHRRARH